jgi:hypothetical protein
VLPVRYELTVSTATSSQYLAINCEPIADFYIYFMIPLCEIVRLCVDVGLREASEFYFQFKITF